MGGEVLTSPEWWQLSDGELHYVWWYIQGSIMEPDVRWRLRRSWGMCQRHAWGALAAEAGFRHNHFHGPAILYEDLLERALRAFDLGGPWPVLRVARRLRSAGPCMMCEMGFDRSSRGVVKTEVVERGRDYAQIRDFADRTREHWQPTVCGRCSRGSSLSRCRPHFVEEAADGTVGDLDARRSEVAAILEHLTLFSRSFRWEERDTETDRDRAALLSAVGWCGGWEAGLALIS
jgi:hypothetical protein